MKTNFKLYSKTVGLNNESPCKSQIKNFCAFVLFKKSYIFNWVEIFSLDNKGKSDNTRKYTVNSIIKVRLFVLTSKSQMTTPKTIQVKTFPTMYHKCPTDHFRKPKGGIHLPLVFFIELNTNKSDCVLQGPCKGLKSGFVLSWPTRRGKYEHRLGFSQQNSIDYVASEKEKTKQRVFRNFQLLLQQNAAFKFTTPFHDSQNKNCFDISLRIYSIKILTR